MVGPTASESAAETRLGVLVSRDQGRVLARGWKKHFFGVPDERKHAAAVPGDFCGGGCPRFKQRGWLRFGFSAAPECIATALAVITAL